MVHPYLCIDCRSRHNFATRCYHLMLGHILSLCRQQLIHLSDHVRTAASGQELQSVFHYSKLGAMYSADSEDTAKFESTPSIMLTQQQVGCES